MLDFGALPPEINSGRMYVGAGSGPTLAAAAAWDELAAELSSTAATYTATIETLTTAAWTGPAALSIAAAAAPYIAWMTATGAQAEQTAIQAKLAAGAYQTAFAATVPPPVIAANRSLLATLVATNFLGLNTAAIAANEAQYAEMWAQDAAAMYAYSAGALGAAQLTPFSDPPQTTDSQAAPAQAAAVSRAAAESAAHTAEQLSATSMSAPTGVSTAAALGAAAAEPVPPLLAAWEQLNYIFNDTIGGPFFIYGINDRAIIGPHWLLFGLSWAAEVNGQKVGAYFAGPKPIFGALAPLVSGVETVPYASAPSLQNLFASAKAAGPVAATMGAAPAIGALSVPPGWAQSAPIRLVSSITQTAAAGIPAVGLGAHAGMLGQMAMSSLAGRAIAASALRSSATAGSGRRASAEVTGEADPAAATIIVIPAMDDEQKVR